MSKSTSLIRAPNALLKYVPPQYRPQETDLTAAVGWGTTFAVGALFLVQPFGWLKETVFSAKKEEK
eukprot:jgi/Mesen1/1196/ME000128S00167